MTGRLQEMYNFGVKRTELFYSTVLSGRTGANVYVKREDLQENKSFKIRGAMNNMLAKIEEGKKDNIFVCASTGNHAQGVAISCYKMHKYGIIFMPKNASQIKIEKTKHFGGDLVEIKLVGDNFDECLAIAEQEVKENTRLVTVTSHNSYEAIESATSIALMIFYFRNGLTKEEVVEVITQLAFYCGWPKAWSTFPIIEEIYGKDEE